MGNKEKKVLVIGVIGADVHAVGNKILYHAFTEAGFELGKGDIAVGTCRGVEAGVLDVPFAPCRINAGKMLPCRDNDGAVRILNAGNLPFDKDLLDFHNAKIEERAKAEKREASFQMVIDDVYSIGKGRLVGRPKY